MLDGTRTESPLSRDELRKKLTVIEGSKAPRGVVYLRIISLDKPVEDLRRILDHIAAKLTRGEESRIKFRPSNPLRYEQPAIVIDLMARERINLD